MTKRIKHPQFSIRATKKDWKRFQKISDAERKLYPVLFHDILNVYEKQQKVTKECV